MPPAFERCEHHEEIGRAFALVFVIEPRWPPLFHLDRSARFGNQLLRGLVQANQWHIGIAWPRVHGQYVFHGRHERAVGLRRNDPLLFQMRLENVFLRVRPIVLSLARSTMFSSTTLFSNNRNVQRARPLGGSEQAKAISLASFSPSKISGNGRRRSWLATQHSLEAFFHQLFADPVNHGCAGLQGLDDLVVAPSFAGFRGVRLQQNPRLHQPLRRAASFPGQCRKLLTFLAAQPHNIFLYDNFPCSHDRLRRSVATKANHQILSNWLKRTTSDVSIPGKGTPADIVAGIEKLQIASLAQLR